MADGTGELGNAAGGARRRSAEVGRAARGAILAIALATALLFPRVLPFLGLLEDRVADLRVARLSAEAAEHPGIVVVGVTEQTLAKMSYRSPIDRGLLAGWIEQLLADGARAVVLDLFLDQPTERDKDARLAGVLAAAEVPVIVARGGAGELTAAQLEFQDGYLPASVITASARLGRDAGVVRWIPGPRDDGPLAPEHGAWLALAPAAARALGRPVPSRRLTIAYRGNAGQEHGGFRHYAAHTLAFVPRLDPDWVRGRVAIVGADLPLTDRHRTPFSGAAGRMPGVLIHAHALAQLLDGCSAPAAGWPVKLALALVLALAGLALALIERPWPLKIALVIVAAALFWAAGFLLYQRAGVLIDLVLPTLGMAVAFALTGSHLSRQRLLEKRAIRHAFGHFVAPAVVRQLEAEPERLQLGGEWREVSYIFTDIAGFTKLSLELEPPELVRLLNEYLDEMSGIVLAHQGTIDKFIGDAVVCLFNAPDLQDRHAARAVRCALELDRCAVAFDRRQQAAGRRFGGTRIGVHTGHAVVGNFGGRERFDYTAIGDTVNTASRLEGANKYLGTRVCVSGTTVERSPDQPFRPVGALVVKGREGEPLPVFEPLAARPAADDGYLAAYRLLETDANAALTAFRELAASSPDDPLAALHLTRLERGERGTRIVLGGK